MNKKFSTLMASLLLASAFSVGNAAANYVKFTENGTNATAIKQGAAYQLKSEDNQVLALVRTGAAYNYSYTLKLVSKDDATKLAETLWKVSYQENKEGGPSFTFVSAAYGIPLSFTPNKDGVNETFPGTESLWKWLPSVKEINGGSVVKNYYKSQVDSVLVLKESDGKIVANRQKASSTEGLKFQAVEAASVVLGADDLNSMMMTQAVGKFKLTFNNEPLNPENGNIWTSGLLKAEPVSQYSPSMFAAGADPVYYSADEVRAVNAAIAAVNALNTAAKAKAQVNAATVTNTNFQAAIVAAAEGANYTAASAAAVNKITELDNDEAETIAAATSKKAAGNALADIITAADYQVTAGANNTKSYLDGQVGAVTITLTTPDAVSALRGAFRNIVYTDNALTSDAEILAAKTAWLKLKTDLGTAKKVSGTITDLTTATAALQTAFGELYNTYSEIILPVGTRYSGAWGKSQINAELAKLAADVNTLCDAMMAETITAPTDAVDKEGYLTAIAGESVTGAGFTATDVQAVVADITTALNANSYITTVAQCKAEVTNIVDALTIPTEQITAEDIAAITAKLNEINADAVKAAVNAPIEEVIDSRSEANALVTLLTDGITATSVNGVASAIADRAITTDTEKTAGVAGGTEVIQKIAAQYVQLSLDKKKKVNGVEKDLYLAVDTNFVTGASGRRHLKFAEWYYAMPTKSDGNPMSTSMERDYNGHFNFKFTYFPTQDSLDIVTDGYAMKPATGAVKNWVDIPDATPTYYYEGNGNTVMLAVLAKNHSEVTVGEPQEVAGSEQETINTRIGFNASVAQATKIDAGVYTIQFVSNDAKKKDVNGRYIVRNWLNENVQSLAKVEDQDLNHMPAAQWVLTHENGSTVNTILNRESGSHLAYVNGQNTETFPISLLYSTATEGMYTTIYGDSLKLAKVDATALKDSTLGYFAAAPYNKETGDQLNVYRLKYLSNLADVFVSFNAADSILNVSAIEAAEAPKFRLIPAADAYQYGVSNEDLAKDLYRQAYYIQYETGKANLKEADKLYITSNNDGKYRLTTSKLDKDGAPTYYDAETDLAIAPFFLKEFKEANGAHSYALVEATYNNRLENYVVAFDKVSVKDYPSTLVREGLEGELQNITFNNWGDYDRGWTKYDGRTSTFLLTKIEAPMYRRLGVTDENDGLINEGTNNVKIYSTRNTNRYLYENTANKVAGYEKDPLGLNFLGDINVKEATKNLSIFVDTAYVRNNTARPQYMLALRPDFTPDTIPCEAHPASHPYDLVDAVHADYLVTLTDSVAAYTKKTTKDKFLFDGYTRLAFVPAKHIGDKLIIKESVFTGDNAKKNEIDLSKNAFVEGAWQFRLTGNEGAEFYIEGANSGSFIRLINGVAVLTKDIADAERFNIEKTDENATANEAIEASEVVVISGKGAITVQGAAGKVITVADILGRTIANQVAASDNVTIAAPAGVLVVTVDGEATKVVVK